VVDRRWRSPLIILCLCAASPIFTRAQVDAGKTAYDRVCQVCHGAAGRGDAGPSLVPLDKEYEEVLAIVREGGGEMPPFSAQRVSDEDVKRIVEYLKSLKRAH
jgi:mono/diheme cytochrome c family protein